MYMASLLDLQILRLVYITAKKKSSEKEINKHTHIGRLISCHEHIKEAVQYRILPDAMPCLAGFCTVLNKSQVLMQSLACVQLSGGDWLTQLCPVAREAGKVSIFTQLSNYHSENKSQFFT